MGGSHHMELKAICDRCALRQAEDICPKCQFKLCFRCRAEPHLEENSRCPRCFTKDVGNRVEKTKN